MAEQTAFDHNALAMQFAGAKNGGGGGGADVDDFTKQAALVAKNLVKLIPGCSFVAVDGDYMGGLDSKGFAEQFSTHGPKDFEFGLVTALGGGKHFTMMGGVSQASQDQVYGHAINTGGGSHGHDDGIGIG